ncbi:hypothetical protein BKA81DRAFT_21543 [Phyllosticta paracitricarpa]
MSLIHIQIQIQLSKLTPNPNYLTYHHRLKLVRLVRVRTAPHRQISSCRLRRPADREMGAKAKTNEASSCAHPLRSAACRQLDTRTKSTRTMRRRAVWGWRFVWAPRALAEECRRRRRCCCCCCSGCRCRRCLFSWLIGSCRYAEVRNALWRVVC